MFGSMKNGKVWFFTFDFWVVPAKENVDWTINK